jgi:hypothetical protein
MTWNRSSPKWEQYPSTLKLAWSQTFESPMETLRRAYFPSLRRPEKPHQEHLDLSIDKSLTISDRAQFRYTDGLDPRNIRLLDIKSGQGEEIIYLSIFTYPLDCAPRYVALSYT